MEVRSPASDSPKKRGSAYIVKDGVIIKIKNVDRETGTTNDDSAAGSENKSDGDASSPRTVKSAFGSPQRSPAMKYRLPDPSPRPTANEREERLVHGRTRVLKQL